MLFLSVDCIWGEWEVGNCSQDCGGGFRINTRKPKLEALNGGKNCEGLSTLNEACNPQNCPGTKFHLSLL